MMEFRNKNMRELKLMTEEASGEVGVEQFFDLYDKAIEDSPYTFFVDFFLEKKEHLNMLRKNFDEWLIPDIFYIN